MTLLSWKKATPTLGNHSPTTLGYNDQPQYLLCSWLRCQIISKFYLLILHDNTSLITTFIQKNVQALNETLSPGFGSWKELNVSKVLDKKNFPIFIKKFVHHKEK